ncbi:hypothetical protein A1355_13455 [Methylomonas koyamae]|uniref:Uncharacterized protein n=1 Tax=Methylomonas koyamae TaxID=702114 RepID=A0A177N696_9GAMM|nr:hypothetical protein A1355_13455 [Methylomonas koyamae]
MLANIRRSWLSFQDKSKFTGIAQSADNVLAFAKILQGRNDASKFLQINRVAAPSRTRMV